MKNGTVKFFDATKGFGFIKDNDGEAISSFTSQEHSNQLLMAMK